MILIVPPVVWISFTLFESISVIVSYCFLNFSCPPSIPLTSSHGSCSLKYLDSNCDMYLLQSPPLWFFSSHCSNLFVTGRNEVVAKVMFLLVCVILSTGVCLSACWDPPGSRHTPPQSRQSPQGADTPTGADNPPRSRHTPRIRSMSSRCASYWNAFLLWKVFSPLELFLNSAEFSWNSANERITGREQLIRTRLIRSSI